MKTVCEYIWLDGTEPTALLRSKAKLVEETEIKEGLVGSERPGKAPNWGFDGSSTNQATGDNSDCILRPVHIVSAGRRDHRVKLYNGRHYLVLCEVFTSDGEPHPTNTRAPLRKVVEQYTEHECMFGFEQEYTLMKEGRALGFPDNRRHFPRAQGPYYCGVGAENAHGRELVEEHLAACISLGLEIEGINAEVMPGQFEFQIGAGDALTITDHLILARWLLARLGEKYDIEVDRDPKPEQGDWNGCGAHTNFSTKETREGEDAWNAIEQACKALETRAIEHIENYGAGIKDRLTGLHETCRWDDFRFGVADRGASVRIPAHVAAAKKGYIEDRRPAANCDPYVVARMLMETICGALTTCNATN